MLKKPVGAGRLSSGYGYRINPRGIGLPERHKGVDYAAPTGTAIYAAADGVIDKIYVSEIYGKYILIEHENDFYTAYAHMNAFADRLEAGSKVTRGEVIGQVGSTGKSIDPHLHFELIHKGKFIDPLFKVSPANTIAAENRRGDDT
ncbi:MAG: M23 family metallopeptidase [Granulosicoccus sp.]